MLLCDAIRILGSPDRAEDVVQDAAVRCLSSAALREAPENPLGLLRRMVRNLALDHYRKHSRETPCEGVVETLVCPSASVEQRLAAREQAARMARSIGRLPPKTRRAFVEARLGARPQTDIAAEMNLSASRVHALIRSAHDQLSAEMAAGE